MPGFQGRLPGRCPEKAHAPAASNRPTWPLHAAQPARDGGPRRGAGPTLEPQIRSRAINNAADSAQLVARFGIQPQLSCEDKKGGLTRRHGGLDKLLRAGYTSSSIVSIEVKNTHGKVVYSNHREQIGQTHAHDAFRAALVGRTTALVVDQMDEVPSARDADRDARPAAPRRPGHGAPDGVFEIYTRYAPVAADDQARHQPLLPACSCSGFVLLRAALPDRPGSVAPACAGRPARTSTRRATTRSPACPTAPGSTSRHSSC